MAAPPHADARPGLPQHPADLRAYQAAGILPPDVIIPRPARRRRVHRLPPASGKLYERIEDYIRRHYNAYKAGTSTQALGFIMTVYRRRLTSSFDAIRCSLQPPP